MILGAKKKNFLICSFLLIILFVIGAGWFLFGRKVDVRCANGELVKAIVEKAENATYEIKRIRPLDEEVKFCMYVLKKKDLKEYVVIFTDKKVEHVFIGDILDVKRGRFIGYEEINFLDKVENGTS